jgi:small subunit ribosomal protein S17
MSAETAVPTRALRKSREGVVVSNKMDKSIVVAVERRVAHPLYKKYLRKTNTFMAHDAENTCQIGDRVRIMETRPLSKHKHWRLVEVLERKK